MKRLQPIMYFSMAKYKRLQIILRLPIIKKNLAGLKYLNVSPTWDALRKEARFKNILLKLGFK